MKNQNLRPEFNKIKFNLTNEIIDFIKELRLKHKIRANELAEIIEKSSAYISKFDKGDYKAISYNDLLEMITAICNNESEAHILLDSFISEYIAKTKSFDCGIKTYDDVIRQIVVPESLIDHINMEIERLKIKLHELIDRINKNVDLGILENNNKYEYNIYYPNPNQTDDDGSLCEDDSTLIGDPEFIKVQLDIEVVKKILSKEITESNFLTIKAILYAISRVDNNSPGNSSCEMALTIADNIMSKFKMYNYQSYKLAVEIEKRRDIVNKELNNSPFLIQAAICELTLFFAGMSKNYLHYSILKAEGLLNNLASDPSFTFALFGIPTNKIKEISYDKKKLLVKEIADLYEKYSKSDTEDKYQPIL